MSPTTVFRELDEAECRALLIRNHVGRIAFALHDRVSIQPIGYVLHQDWLACRTQEGAKIDLLRRSPYVAFEVDEVSGPLDWTSVIIQGSVYEQDPESVVGRETIEVFQTLMPDAFAPGDVTPHRDVLIRVHIREMSGRSASTHD